MISGGIRQCLLPIAALLAAGTVQGQAKRLVLVKVDGLAADRIEQLLPQIDPQTGRSILPWMHYIFLERGTWVRNFYVRGISLSAPSWSMLDTGQHLAIRGNAEFDRFTPRVYDYLNFFPFYAGYARSQRVDMPSVEVLDQFGIPLLLDQFPADARYQSMQLFQRGVRWTTLKGSVTDRVKRPLRELINEWETGFEMSPGIEEQEEKEIIAALADPKILYLDLYLGDYDHTAHLTNDEPSQLAVIKRLDALLGRLWGAIQASPLAAETVLVLVSDHGMNTKAGTYSQGYNLVKLFNSSEGGGHHVVTVRYPLTEYRLVGLDPFVSYVISPSSESLYLRKQDDYPTALIDPDGNERAAVQLRNSDLNAIHTLLLQLKRGDLGSSQRTAVREGVLRIVEANRPVWAKTLAQLNEELTALRKAIERQQALVRVDRSRKKREQSGFSIPELNQADRRHLVTLETWQTDERGYREYARSTHRLLDLKESDLEPGRIHIETLIPKGVMGEPNSLYQLQNYVVGLSRNGIVLTAGGSLDLDGTFQRVNYFTTLARRACEKPRPARRWNRADRFCRGACACGCFGIVALARGSAGLRWQSLFSRMSNMRLLLLSQFREGTLWLRYSAGSQPGAGCGGNDSTSRPRRGADGFSLRLFEDPELRVSGKESTRATWLNQWHTEREWFEAIHRTRYSNGVVGLYECFQRSQPASIPEPFRIADERDWPLLRALRGKAQGTHRIRFVDLRFGPLEFQRARVQSRR